MTDYADQIDRIKQARSLEDIQQVVREFPAKASGEGGILYSGRIGEITSETIAKELAEKSGQPIINNTPRAQFLSSKVVEESIDKAARRIFESMGEIPAVAEKSALSFRFGDAKAPTNSPTSLSGSLWGEASREFAGYLRGDVSLVATAASPDRVFGQVELPAALENTEIKSLGSRPISSLKVLHAQGGVEAVLPEVQKRFIDAAPQGIFSPSSMDGKKITQVKVSKEVAEAMGVDATKFTSAAELSASGLSRTPIVPMPSTAALSESTIAGEAAAATRGGLRPALIKGGGIVVLAGATAYDIGVTAEKTSQLRSQGNEVGVQSELIHFGARNVGAWGGAALGAGAGALAGVETGPGLLVTGAIGGIVGTVAGDKLAAYLDNRSIYNQEDRQHNTWTFDPEKPNNGWRRTVLADTTLDGVENEIKRTFVAGTDLTNELNFKASSTSVQLMFRNPPTPSDPYTLPSDKNDTPSSKENSWVRIPESGQWQREVFGAFVERGMTPRHTETADANRASELNRNSEAVISQNAANSTAAIATRFEAGHAQYGWAAYGAIPEAVSKERGNVGVLLASDGNTYQRGQNGDWKSEGMLYDSHAQGNLRDELNGTRQQLQTYLSRQPELPAPPMALTPQEKLRETVASTYANAGVPRTPEQLETATSAVERQHQLKAVGTAYAMTLQADSGTPAYSATSAIATLQQNAEGVWTPKAITTAQDIQRVMQEQAPAMKPGQAKPNNNDVPQNDKPKSLPAEGSTTSFASPPRAELDQRDRNHPDHALYQQALTGVHQHDAKLGRIPDEKSEQMAASLTALAKENGMNRIDHVVFSVDNGRGVKAGENVFVVQGEMGNPGADRAHMKTDVAVNASVQSTFQQIESVSQKQAQEVLTQQSQQQTQQAQVQQQSGGSAMRAMG